MKRRRAHKIFWTLVAVIVLLAAAVIWLYSGKLTLAKEKILAKIPLPLATVNGKAIWSDDYVKRYRIQQRFMSQTQDSPSVRATVINKLVREEEVKQLSKQQNITVDNRELGAELARIKKDSQTPGQTDLATILKSYGLSEQDFEQKILKQSLLETKLLIWYNANRDLNAGAYRLADDIVGRANSGEDFGALAKKYTQDDQGALQGDMGAVKPENLLPELAAALANPQKNEIKIIPTRLGLNIVKVENVLDDGGLHLREITLKTNSFQEWFEAQTRNFKIKILFKI